MYQEKCITLKKSYLKENEIFAGFVGRFLDWWKDSIAEASAAKCISRIWKVGFLWGESHVCSLWGATLLSNGVLQLFGTVALKQVLSMKVHSSWDWGEGVENSRNQPTSSQMLDEQLSFAQPPQLSAAVSPSAWGGDWCHSRTRLRPPQCLSVPRLCSLHQPYSSTSFCVWVPAGMCVLLNCTYWDFFFHLLFHSVLNESYGCKMRDLDMKSKHLCGAWWPWVLMCTCYGPPRNASHSITYLSALVLQCVLPFTENFRKTQEECALPPRDKMGLVCWPVLISRNQTSER